MKGGKSLAEAKEEYRINGFCIVCSKGFQYPYGRWHREGQLQSGTCSLNCERKHRDSVLAEQSRRAADFDARVLSDSVCLEVRSCGPCSA